MDLETARQLAGAGNHVVIGSRSKEDGKTALNQFTVQLAQLLNEENIKVYSAHPGWVKIDMGGENAPLSVEEGAKTMVGLALGNTEFESGS